MEAKRNFGVRLNLEHQDRLERSSALAPERPAERLAALEWLLSPSPRETAWLRDALAAIPFWPGGSPGGLDPAPRTPVNLSGTTREVRPLRLRVPVEPVMPPPVEPEPEPPPAIADLEQGWPAGLEQWYRDEHIPRGRSNRAQDLAAARERFGRWVGDRNDMIKLRRKCAPADWSRSGRPVKNISV